MLAGTSAEMASRLFIAPARQPAQKAGLSTPGRGGSSHWRRRFEGAPMAPAEQPPNSSRLAGAWPMP